MSIEGTIEELYVMRKAVEEAIYRLEEVRDMTSRTSNTTEALGELVVPVSPGEIVATFLDENLGTLFESYEELSKKSGASLSTINRILDGETYEPQAKTLRRLEKALGLEEGGLGV